MIKAVHYKATGSKHKHICMGARWPGSLTREMYIELWKQSQVPPTTTNILKVTCPACLREIRSIINLKLGE